MGLRSESGANILLFSLKDVCSHVKCSYHAHKLKGTQETLEGIVYVYYLDCGNGIMGVCIHPNSSSRTQKVFLCELSQ